MELTNSSLAIGNANISINEEKFLHEIAISASQLGGEILLQNYGNIETIRNKGRVGDLVTNADLASEKEIINFLNNKTPEIGIVAEESGDCGTKSELTWYIDPLDGTTNYAHGYPFFATSIGLTWKSIPILGAIYVPFLKEIYSGSPNIGAFCNELEIHTSDCLKIRDSLLVTGFAYDRQTKTDNNYAEFCWLTHRSRGVRRGGAAAVDLAFVAAGRLDGYWEQGLAKWDLAAGIAIVEAAGGKINDYKSGKFDLSNGRVLACTSGIEKQLLEELSKVKPLDGKAIGEPNL